MMGALLHPPHCPVMTGLQPSLQLKPSPAGGIRWSKAACDEAEARCFGSYCFLKALTPMHGQVPYT
jgi:hypothetical protein